MRADNDLFSLGITNVNLDPTVKNPIQNFWDSIGQWNTTAWDSASTWKSNVWNNASTWTPETWEAISQWNDTTWIASKTWTPETWNAPLISLLDAKVVEGNTGFKIVEFQISLSKSSDRPLSFKYSTDNGTAIAGQDYVAASSTLIFNPGETLKTISIQVIGDSVFEQDETFSLKIEQALALPKDSTQIETPLALAKNTATATIQNDEAFKDDLYGNGRATIIYRNQTTGRIALSSLTPTNTLQPLTYLNQTLDTTWTLKTISDFNGDRKADLLWENSQTYEVQLWTMDGATITNNQTLTNPNYKIAATGDFNNDSKTDILWQDIVPTRESTIDRTVSNAYYIQLNPTTAPQYINRLGLEWRIDSTADFNGDKKADILFKNSTSNPANIPDRATIWLMNGTTLLQSTQPIAPPDALGFSTYLIGTGDYNSDNQSDLLWITQKTFKISVWEINQGQTQSFKIPDSPANTNRAPVPVYLSDFTGDGKNDLLDSRPDQQLISITQANGTYTTFSLTDPTLNTVRQSWTVQTKSDYNGDGISDLTLRDTNNGSTKILLFNNSSLTPTPPQSIALNQLDTSIWKLIG